MADPWSAIGDFLANALGTAGQNLASRGGVLTSMLGSAMEMPQQNRLNQTLQDIPQLKPYAPMARMGIPLKDILAAYKDLNPTSKPTGFEEYKADPIGFAAYGQALHPEAAQTIELRKQALADAQKNREAMQQERQQFHQDTEQDRALQRALSAQNMATLRGLQANGQQFNQMMAQTQDQERKEKLFQSQAQNLTSQREKLTAMMTSKTPPPPGTLSSMIARYNAQAASLRPKAPQFGADPSQFEPLSLSSPQPKSGLMGAIERRFGGGMTPPTLGDLPNTLPQTTTTVGGPVSPMPGAASKRSRTGRPIVQGPDGKWRYAD